MERDLDTWSFITAAQPQIERAFPEVDLLANRLSLSITRAASAILYDFESTIHRPLGGTWSGFRILFALWLAGPASANGVSQVTGMSRAAVSNLCRSLMEKGLIRKEDDPSDGRAVVLSLTDEGLTSIKDAFVRQHVRERAWAGLLTPLEQEILVMLLDKVMTGRESIHANERS